MPVRPRIEGSDRMTGSMRSVPTRNPMLYHPLAHQPARRTPRVGVSYSIILLIVGVAAIVVGVLYLTQPVHSLPTFFPGYAAHVVSKHTNRGYAGIALGAVLVIVAFVVALTGPRRRSLS